MRRSFGIAFLVIAAVPYLAMLWTRREASEPAPATAQETLTIISPHRREVKQEYSRAFRDWMRTTHGRSVDIRWLDVGGTSKIVKELESRFHTAPDDPGVDVLFGGGLTPYMQATEQGWLDPVDLPADLLGGIPATCAGSAVYDPEHRWFGVALSGFGILYHRDIARRLGVKEPVNWDDLGRPEYLSWVGSGDPRSSGSVHMCYEIILQAYGFDEGWGLITRICANVRGFGEAGGTAPREVAAGDVVAGMVIDQYAKTVLDAAGGDSMAFVLPEKTTIIGPDAIARLRGSRQRELAGLFVAFTLSAEGQRVLYQAPGVNGQKAALHRLPVREACYREPSLEAVNPYAFSEGLKYSDAVGSKRYAILNDLMGVWLIDAHEDLVRAWQTVIRNGCRPQDVHALCAPPVTAVELNQLAGEWRDPKRRQQVMAAWAEAAACRYQAVAASR